MSRSAQCAAAGLHTTSTQTLQDSVGPAAKLSQHGAQVAIKDSAPFDPYNILELEKGATDKEVKRAYRQLSLKFHPDKNPDPEANKYFAEYITKAYQALSDPVARDNYEKYGHPDGQQVSTVRMCRNSVARMQAFPLSLRCCMHACIDWGVCMYIGKRLALCVMFRAGHQHGHRTAEVAA